MDKALLTRSTSKEDSPTPGYLYGEIARMTQHSYDTCTKVMEFLVSRVKNKHHTIKFKALQVIKHVCREGRTDFKRDMQRHIPIIKECLQFRGPPDPLKGDEYYRRVRDSAKECLDAIYDTDMTPGLGSMGMSARIQGVGNPVENAGNSGGIWGSKLPWGKNNSEPNAVPPPGPQMGRYPPPAGGYNAPTNPNMYGYPGGDNRPGGYTGPNAAENPQYGNYPSYQPEYGGYDGAPPPYGGPPPYGAPQMNDHRLSGIGNPLFQDSRDEKGFLKGLREKASSKFSKSDSKNLKGAPPGAANPPDGWSYATNRGPTGGNYIPGGLHSYNPDEVYRPRTYGGGYQAGSIAYSGSSDPREAATSQLREKSYDGDRKKGRVGGSWSNTGGIAPPSTMNSSMCPQNTDLRGQNMHNSAPDYHHEEYKSHREPTPQIPIGQTLGAQSDGSYESNLVSALCAPGGMRAVPPKDKMDSFIKCAPNLDPEIVGPILEDCLAEEQWTVVSKALATIEALLKADGCDGFFEYFADNSSEIEACAHSDKAAIRDKAVKIMKTLGVSANVDANESYSRTVDKGHKQSQASNPQTDLLGGFEQDQVSSQSGQASLFSGLQTSTPSQPNEPSDVSTENVNDMFGGLSIQAERTSASITTAPAPPPNTNPTLILDPLLQPVSCPVPQQNNAANYGMNTMNYNPQQMNQMQQMAQMQYMHYIQQMQGMGAVHGSQMNSQVIGAAMTPTGYIAKTIQEPSDNSNSGFGFIKKQDDSFNFVKDAMKNG